MESYEIGNKMQELNSALQKQKKDIEELKRCAIHIYKGFGKKILLTFGDLSQYPDGGQGVSETQKKINEGYYQSIEDFDSYHTADIEFADYYRGKKINEYREKTKFNLIELGKAWRDRVSKEYPEADITIVVHEQNGDWFLDTFNYSVVIENAVYI